MFKLIFVAFILFVVHKLWTHDVLSKLMEAVEEFSNIPQAKEISPAIRSRDMESEFGKPWRLWDPQAVENSEFDHPTLRTPQTRRYFGPMDMEVAGDQVLIYDLLMGYVDFKGLPFQTVIAIKPPELRLPPFIVRPKGINSESFTREGVVIVKSDSDLDTRFTLETLLPLRTKALFQSTLGTDVLIPFLNERDWTLQWTGKSLIVYKWNHLIDPARLAETALEVSEFFELLKSGQEVIDQEMQELIRETARKQTKFSSIGLKVR